LVKDIILLHVEFFGVLILTPIWCVKMFDFEHITYTKLKLQHFYSKR